MLFREKPSGNDGHSAGIPQKLLGVGQITFVASQSGLSPTPWDRFLFW